MSASRNRRRFIRRGQDSHDQELHYGEETRRRARALGLRGEPPSERNRFLDAGGRFGAAAHDPIVGWYQPDATTTELPVIDDDAFDVEEPPSVTEPGAAPGTSPPTGAPADAPPVRPSGRAGPGGASPAGTPPAARPGSAGPVAPPPADVPPADARPADAPPADAPPGQAPFGRAPAGRGPTRRAPAERARARRREAPWAPPPSPPSPAQSPPSAPPFGRQAPPPSPPASAPPTGAEAPAPPTPPTEPSAPLEPPPPTTPAPPRKAAPSPRRASLLVAAGILASRTAGLLREVIIGFFMGVSPAADAFKAALRIPNVMQNLLGEGVLSASFIPVYAKLRADGDDETAGKLAGSIAGLLLALTGVLSLLGVVLAEPIARVLVTGFSGTQRFDLTVDLVRIMFPAIGFLVLSAWCLGVLNSHRKFFLSYVAPVLWNAAQIVALVAVGLAGFDNRSMAVALAWGVLIGGFLQMAVQLPSVLRLLGRLRLSLSTSSGPVRAVLGRFGPVVMARGVVQIMGFVDLWLAAFLATGAISSLTFAQVLYLLPISLFGMSVAAAELPDLSTLEVDDAESRRDFRRRLEAGMSRILFYVAPTATLFIVAGDIIVALLFGRGEINAADERLIWLTVATFSLGLPAMTVSRLLQNALYGLGDARTPARLAAVRVFVSATIGLALMFPLDRLTIQNGQITGWGDVFALGPLGDAARDNPAGIPHLGILGLAFGAAVSAWVEYRLLSTALAWRIGRSRLGGRWLNPIAMACASMAIVAFLGAIAFSNLNAVFAAPLVLLPAGLVYLLVTRRLDVPEARIMTDRLLALLRSARRPQSGSPA